ncbi:hypothetical protein HPP92_000676 [Vanilla planifolia]|uniref:BRCT domain-containing protein n=1 Tax=Vanilla planifolia TaxID=51239 RepID=A0A835VGB5_VANPL|nr:hypothetical protein HPP92_000676 [Vanilla planifolia]
MGGAYRSDWTSDCTLLICAFPGTPKFRQVETDCGTIVSKEWISACYNQRKLVEIEPYLMHVGKQWRRFSKPDQLSKDQGTSLIEQSQKQAGKRPSGSTMQKDTLTKHFLPSKIKEWVADDLRETMSWLESQDEKPEADDMRSIAAEGIVACLQDAIDSLKQNNDVSTVAEQWMFVPHVVKYLAELEINDSVSKKELYELANSFKRTYETELKQFTHSEEDRVGSNEENVEADELGFDSDQTIEMTQEEIDLACKQLGC